jgi:hypothetical protein
VSGIVGETVGNNLRIGVMAPGSSRSSSGSQPSRLTEVVIEHDKVTVLVTREQSDGGDLPGEASR